MAPVIYPPDNNHNELTIQEFLITHQHWNEDDLPYEEWSCHIAITPHTNVLTALLGGETSSAMSNWHDQS